MSCISEYILGRIYTTQESYRKVNFGNLYMLIPLEEENSFPNQLNKIVHFLTEM